MRVEAVQPFAQSSAPVFNLQQPDTIQLNTLPITRDDLVIRASAWSPDRITLDLLTATPHQT